MDLDSICNVVVAVILYNIETLFPRTEALGRHQNNRSGFVVVVGIAHHLNDLLAGLKSGKSKAVLHLAAAGYH